MKKSSKKVFAVLACAAIVTSSAVAAYAAQAPAAGADGTAYAAAQTSSESPLFITLRKFYPAGEGRYAYELHYSPAIGGTSEIAKVEIDGVKADTSGYFVKICNGYIYHEFRVTMKDGRVITQVFTYGSPSSSSSM